MNSFFTDLRNYFKNDKSAIGGAPTRGAGNALQRRRLHIESLEDRTLLAICFVDADASSGGNGSSWNSAYRSLQDALNAAGSSSSQITEIWVAEGTYTPSSTAGFSLVDGVSLYGGFAGTESNLSQRTQDSQGNFVYQTVLSGDLAQNDDPNKESTFSDNAYTVLFGRSLTSALTVDGITVSGGYASSSTTAVDTIDSQSVNSGGGIVLYHCNIALNNVVVSNNYAKTSGAGIYIEGGTTVLQNSSIASNSTAGNGGGIYLASSGVLNVEDTVFADNYAGYYGGGFYQYNGTFEITASHFSGNVARYGGGYAQSGDGVGMISSSSFISNIAQDLYSYGSVGGAIHQSGKTDMTDVTLAGNVARIGGAIYFYNEVDFEGVPTIEASTYQNLTISRNVARETGGGLYIGNGLLNLNASIVAANTASISPDIFGEKDSYTGDPKPGLVLTGSNNLIGNGTGIPEVASSSSGETIRNGVNGNRVGGSGSSTIDPRTGAPTNSGNGVFVLPLLSDSPALGQSVRIGVVGVATAARSAQTYLVTSLADEIAEDGVLTFREAFEAANGNIAVGDAPAGSFTEKDTITFQTGLTGTIELNGKSLTIYDGLTISGWSNTEAGTDSQNSLIIDAKNQSSVVKAVGAIQVNLSGLTLANGFSYSDGAGLFAYSSTITLDKVTVKDSKSKGGQGGGIFALKATLDATDIIVSGCSAQFGGGIYLNGTTATIVGASVYSNTASNSGGGIYLCNNNTTSLISNATIARNQALFGAGLTISSARATLTQLTVTRNVGEYSGGMLVDSSSTVEMNNSIVADNFSYRVTDISVYTNASGSTSAVLNGRYNLVGDNNGLTGLTDSSNKIGTTSNPLDPLFYSASIYNGRLIYTLSTASPAVNSGSNSLAVGKNGAALVYDVRGTGYSRISGSTVDMGACEYQSTLAGSISSVSSALRKGQTLDLQGIVSVGSSTGATYLWDLNNNGIYGEIGAAATEGLEINEYTTFDSTNAVRESGGLYPVRLIIVDANGNRSDPVELQLNIISNPATYEISGETTFNVYEPQEWLIEAMNTESDPIMTWTISWGDSTKTVIAGGPRNEVSVRHVYAANGTYSLTIETVTYFGDIQTYTLAKFQVLAAVSASLAYSVPVSEGTGQTDVLAASATSAIVDEDLFVETPEKVLDETIFYADTYFVAELSESQSDEPFSAAATATSLAANSFAASRLFADDFQDDETEVSLAVLEQRLFRSQRRNSWRSEWNAAGKTDVDKTSTADLAEIATLEKAEQDRATDSVLANWSELDEFFPRRMKSELF